ncbi:PepSY-like domain-containing protein [Cesiribacter sp. SM1]|uniref:PepSY-like domain-containing protein n=1 Tax=Cesiribacter sp. SM1 TaxID=2861196 RepID=UPI001CD5343B|nr:PepSY-like domain-containing protein [Cesiribacter sp. SM1]
MSKYYFLFAAIICCTSCSPEETNSGQDSTSSLEQADRINTASAAGTAAGINMDAAKASFERQYPSATDVEWNEDANGYYEASFKQEGEKYRADYTKEGNWIETESSLKFDELPKTVQDVIEKDYDKDEITEIEQVDNAEKGKFYDVEFKQKGKNMDVEIRENGQIISQ